MTLQTAIWTSCIQKMSNFFISNARKYPQPFMKDIGLKLPFIDEKLKVRIVKIYLSRQIIYHCIRFLQWQILEKT
jgi:hypothetical protein